MDQTLRPSSEPRMEYRLEQMKEALDQIQLENESLVNQLTKSE